MCEQNIGAGSCETNFVGALKEKGLKTNEGWRKTAFTLPFI